jgi:uncharacterized protein (TIRG00374 family)
MLSRKVKIIINVVTIVALLALLVVSWPQITEGLKEIGGAKWSIIFLMIPLQVLNFFAIGKIYQTYFKNNNGHHITPWFGLKLALELNFVNHVFPSGGVAGFSYLGIRLKEKGIPVASTTLAQVVRFALTFVSFLLILFIGMFLLSFGSGSSGGGVALFIGLSIAFLTLFALIVAIYIFSSEKRIKAFTAFLPKLFNVVVKPITKKELININKIELLFSDFHKDYVLISKDWRKLKQPFIWALVVNTTEITTAYMAYIALGSPVNPGAVILAYAIASFAGLISVLPGGIGVYEALMTAVLASAGVPKALALSATLIYRIFTIIVFVPIGFVLYQLALKHNGKGLKDGTKIITNSN